MKTYEISYINDYNEISELSELSELSNLGKKFSLKKAFKIPAKIKKFVNNAGKAISKVAKNIGSGILKNVLPMALKLLPFGTGALVSGIMEKGKKIGTLTSLIKNQSPAVKTDSKKVIFTMAQTITGGGTGIFAGKSDIINKLVAFKSAVKPETDITTALTTGKSLGFTSEQIASIITDNKVKINNENFDLSKFDYGNKASFTIDVKEKPEKPSIETEKGKQEIYKLFNPDNFELSAEKKTVSKTPIKKPISKDEKQRAELKKKKEILLRNISTLDKNIKTLKDKFYARRKYLKREQERIISDDIKNLDNNLLKMKKELEKMSSLNLSSLDIAPLIVVGLVGAIAYVSGKIVDVVKMQKTIDKDNNILNAIKTGTIKASDVKNIISPDTQKKSLINISPINILPYIIIGGLIILPKILKLKKKR